MGDDVSDEEVLVKEGVLVRELVLRRATLRYFSNGDGYQNVRQKEVENHTALL